MKKNIKMHHFTTDKADRLSAVYGSRDTFTVKSNELVISDPCYRKGTWCAGEIAGPKKGEWEAYVDYRYSFHDGCRYVAHLFARHTGYKAADVASESGPMICGVDSGQLGIFDGGSYGTAMQFRADGYPETPAHMYSRSDPDMTMFFGFACDCTLSEGGLRSGALIPEGCVSCSGYGDGAYEEVGLRNAYGELIAVEVEFIPPSYVTLDDAE